ncbi:MAG: Gfo/Idh/MocA family oxidoreductase [Gemmataceae bacterium]|nr:Gfo/Idh/MocA family oxidoreductase [Gemmataceae bacterium]
MTTSPKPTRRTALTAAAGLPLSLLAGPPAFARRDDRPKVALIGCGGQGRGDAQNATRFGPVVAVCDVDKDHAAQAAKQFKTDRVYADFRQLLEKEKDVSVVVNATPDHWHTLANIACVRAGKDVYAEKPLTLTIDEGKRLAAEVKKHGRVLQTGSQQRSDGNFRKAVVAVRAGRLGKLSAVTSTLPAGKHGGPFKPSPVPPGLDWDFWQGQAPAAEYVKERCHVDFRFWLEYSGGTLTDWGAHHNDIVLWAVNKPGPVAVEGKRLLDPVPGGYTTPAEYDITFTYADGLRHRCNSTTASSIFGGTQKARTRSETAHGIRFEGADGWLFVTRGKLEASKPEVLADLPDPASAGVYVSDDHMKNFFDCVKTRKAPICDAQTGHRSVSVCHLGGIALRLGRKLAWDPAKEEFVGDKEANGMLAREQRKPWTYDLV